MFVGNELFTFQKYSEKTVKHQIHLNTNSATDNCPVAESHLFYPIIVGRS